MGGESSLQEVLYDLFLDRALEIKDEMIGADSEAYTKAIDAADKIHMALEALLPEMCRDLMFKLDEIGPEIREIEMVCAYRAGFRDGFELANGLKVFGTDYELVLSPAIKTKANDV